MNASVLAFSAEPVADCGDDLEYDADFLALQQAAVGKAEQQFGATIIPAESPDWPEVERLAQALAARTQDLRVSVYLTRAWTGLRGLPGYAEGAARVVAQLQQYWEGVHPRLDIDEQPDPMPRINALLALADPLECAREARSARLLNGVHGGQLSLRDAEAILDGSRDDLPSYPGGRARLLGDLRQAWLQGDPELLALAGARDALRQIRETVASHLGGEWAPNYAAFERTLDMLVSIAQGDDNAPATAASRADPIGAAAAPAACAGEAQPAAGVSAQTWQSAQITSREEAMAMLSKVCRYFEVHEPSHPAPFLLRRAQQTMSLNFHEILRNLAPQGLEQFEAWLPRERGSQGES